MDKEEIKLYVKNSCENILKQLAENPKEMLDLLELQDKYNNLLKEKIELKRQIKKQKEVFDKATEYIKERFYFNEETGEYSLLHTFDKCNAKELLDIFNEVSE